MRHPLPPPLHPRIGERTPLHRSRKSGQKPRRSTARTTQGGLQQPQTQRRQTMPRRIPQRMRQPANPTRIRNPHNAAYADRGFLPRSLSYACRRPKPFTETDWPVLVGLSQKADDLTACVASVRLVAASPSEGAGISR